MALAGLARDQSAAEFRIQGVELLTIRSPPHCSL
jgi:hypothetical protein